MVCGVEGKMVTLVGGAFDIVRSESESYEQTDGQTDRHENGQFSFEIQEFLSS